MSNTKTVSRGTWTVGQTLNLSSLVIAEGASITAPEGKSLTMTVNGTVTAINPGRYEGDVILSVSSPYVVPGKTDPFLHGKDLPITAAAYIKDSCLIPDACVLPAVSGGRLDAAGAENISMTVVEDDFTGLIIENSDYTIKDSVFEFTGEGANDNYGVGAAVIGLGKSNITLDNVELIGRGAVTRALTYMADDCTLTVRNSRIDVESGKTDRMSPAWMLGLRGTNRPTQQCDRARSVYENCRIHSNGWGVFSVEAATDCSVYVKDSVIDLSGDDTRGYGMMSINKCVDTLDNCKADIQGYGFLICNPNSRGVITGASQVNASVYGAIIFRNHNGRMTVNGGSNLSSGSSSFVVKGSQTTIECDNAVLSPGNGVILQLMDNDEPGMQIVNFKPSNGEKDTYSPGRDLTTADPDTDVFASFSNMEVIGDIFNSTTNLFIQTRGDPGQCPGMPVPDFDLMPKPDPDAPAVRGTGLDLQGAHNLEVSFNNARVTGVISAATAWYADGLEVIDPDNREELSNIKQVAAPAVNNGVIVKLSGGSIWTVTGTSYLTSLSIEPGAMLKAPDGMSLVITVDGEAKSAVSGEYFGNIVISPVLYDDTKVS